MTCIVGLVDKNKVWMGCDSAVSNGWLIETLQPSQCKIRCSIHGVLVGCAGNLRDLQLIPHIPYVKNPDSIVEDWRKNLSEHGALITENGIQTSNTSLLIAIQDTLFSVKTDFSIVEHSRFWALGSGDEVALGVLYATPKLSPEKRIKLALQATSDLVSGVRPPFHIFNT